MFAYFVGTLMEGDFQNFPIVNSREAGTEDSLYIFHFT